MRRGRFQPKKYRMRRDESFTYRRVVIRDGIEGYVRRATVDCPECSAFPVPGCGTCEWSGRRRLVEWVPVPVSRCLICESQARGTLCQDCGNLMLRHDLAGGPSVRQRFAMAKAHERQRRRDLGRAIRCAWSAGVDVFRWRWLAAWPYLLGNASAIKRAMKGEK